jgi:hypothetical protein
MPHAGKTRTRPRWKHRIAAAVGLGLITTVLVAWGLVLFAPPTNRVFIACYLNSSEAILVIQETVQSPERTAFTEWYYLCPADSSEIQPDRFNPTFEPSWRLDNQTLPAACDAMERAFEHPVLPAWVPRSIDAPTGAIGYLHLSAGWPLRCLRSTGYIEGVNQPFRMQWSLRFRPPRSAPHPVTRNAPPPSDGTLPLLPIPLGFAANTALFSAAWWVLLLGHRDVRRVIRRRRNLCEHCAYSRESLAPATPCPECGAPVG